MAQNLLGQKKKKQELVPPPPPTFSLPAIAQSLNLMGQQAPQPGAMQPMPDLRAFMAGTQPVPVPQPPATPAQSSFVPDLTDAEASYAHLKSLAQGARDNASAPTGMLPSFVKFDPDTGEISSTKTQSPMEKLISDRLGKDVMHGLTGGSDKMDRFDKGYSIGQRIAASLVVPALGVFGHGAGTAAGANAAVAQLEQQVANERAQQRADHHARNESMYRLATMWESLDPKSAKNLNERLKLHLEGLKANNDLQHNLNTAALGATKDESNAATELAKIKQTGQNEQFKAGSIKYGQDLDRVRALQGENQFQAQLYNMLGERDYRHFQGLMQLHNANTADQKFDFEKKNAAIQNQLKQSGIEGEAVKSLDQELRLEAQNAMATNALGQPKYPNYDKYLAADGVQAGIEKKIKLAGLEGKLTAKQALGAIVNQMQQQQTQGGGGGIDLSWILPFASNAAKGLVNTMNGGGAPAPGKAETPEEAIAKLKSAGVTLKKGKDGKWQI